MPPLSNKSIMAISAVVDIALSARGKPVPAGGLAKRLQLSSRYLEPVLHALTRQGILMGVRGPNGGYKLAQERHAISAYDIFQAVKTIEADVSTQSYSGLAGAVVLPALARQSRFLLVLLNALLWKI